MVTTKLQQINYEFNGNFDYTRHLVEKAQQAKQGAKSHYTKLIIIAAASQILAEQGYHQLRMADIAIEANLSHGAIYRYFNNKRAVTFEVLQGYGLWGLEIILPPDKNISAYQGIFFTTNRFVELFRYNIGLNRCNRQLSDEYREFAILQMEYNASWYRKVASALARKAATTERAASEAFSVASIVGGMVDEMLHNVYVREDPTLSHFRRSSNKLVTTLSTLWYRAAFACNPPTKEINGSHALLELHHKEATK